MRETSGGGGRGGDYVSDARRAIPSAQTAHVAYTAVRRRAATANEICCQDFAAGPRSVLPPSAPQVRSGLGMLASRSWREIFSYCYGSSRFRRANRRAAAQILR